MTVYIGSLDAKDIYLSNNYIDSSKNGYSLKKSNGEYNTRRFKNTLDYSLDLIKLREIFKKAYHDSAKDMPFSIFENDKEYCPHVINVTFKYSVREFNQITKDTYIRIGYRIQDCSFNNAVAYNEAGDLIGIKTNVDSDACHNVPDYFLYIKSDDDLYGHYEITGGVPLLKTRKELREWVYTNGFLCDGVKFVRFKRSSGSARVGKCLFINEKLYSRMHTYEKCGLTVRNGQKIDLAAWEAYISLTSSSIIDTLEIKQEEILVIDDYESVFTDTVMATKVVNGHLLTEPETIDVSNSIWDGQSLIDISAMGKYSNHGMLLLRNRFFKSCCFNTNIQKWFEDNGIKEISQLHGYTRAKSVSEIKLITTPSSIKFLKFGSLDMWMDKIETIFGIVKYEKKTHYFDGELVRTHYQLLNTLQLSYDETIELLRDSLDYIYALRDDPAVLRNYLRYTKYDDEDIIGASNKNEIVHALMNINDEFSKTAMYSDFVRKLIKSQIDLLKCGRVLVHGNYSTLLGNPVEMLLSSIGKFTGESQIGIGNIHSSRFEYGIDILGSRSPHVTIGNILIANNAANKEIDTYLNLTPEICCLNSINENNLARLSGSDYDSDTMLITNNSLLIRTAKKNYDKFLVPTSLVSADKMNRFFTDEQKADLDFKTSVNKIGEIINFSQILNSLLWDNIAHGESFEQNMELYADIAQLDVMSNLEIDKAKKIFEVDNSVELKLLKEKYKLNDENGLQVQPKFFMHVARKKGYYIEGKKNYKFHMTTMDYIQAIVDKVNNLAARKSNLMNNPLSFVLNKEDYDYHLVKQSQIERIIDVITDSKNKLSNLYGLSYSKEEKKIYQDRIMYDVVIELSKFSLSYSTAYRLMFELDTNPKYSKIKTYAFYLLLSVPVLNFYSVFSKSNAETSILLQTNDAPDCYFYGIPYKHCRLLPDNTSVFDDCEPVERFNVDDALTKSRQIYSDLVDFC